MVRRMWSAEFASTPPQTKLNAKMTAVFRYSTPQILNAEKIFEQRVPLCIASKYLKSFVSLIIECMFLSDWIISLKHISETIF